MNRWDTVRGSPFWKSYLGGRPLFGFSHRFDSNQLPTTPGISFAPHITPDTVSGFLLQSLLMVRSLSRSSKFRLFTLGDVECNMLEVNNSVLILLLYRLMFYASKREVFKQRHCGIASIAVE